MKAKILLAAHDPGGISALGPLAPALAHFANLEFWLHPLSAPLYPGKSRRLAALTLDEAMSALAEARPDMVITGTSMGPESIDKIIIRAAARLNIPSLAFVDFWSNYGERFLHADGSRIYPTLIATIDEVAKAEMIAAGIPAGRIKVIGFPRAIARSAAKLNPPSTCVILFISQALAEVYGGEAACRTRFGYTQQDAFHLLAAALPAFEARLGRKVELWLRHHPKEAAWTAKGLHLTVTPQTAEECLSQADIVAGMTGSLMIDALLMGLPVISIQPGLKGPDLFMPSRQGYVPLVREAAGVLPALEGALNRPPQLPPALAASTGGQAVTRFAGLVAGLLARKSLRQSA